MQILIFSMVIMISNHLLWDGIKVSYLTKQSSFQRKIQRNFTVEVELMMDIPPTDQYWQLSLYKLN